MNSCIMIHADNAEDKIMIEVSTRIHAGEVYHVVGVDAAPMGGSLSLFLTPARLLELRKACDLALAPSAALDAERDAAVQKEQDYHEGEPAHADLLAEGENACPPRE